MHVRRIPKVSIFMAVPTKIVIEKTKKWPKIEEKIGQNLALIAGSLHGRCFLSMSTGN